MQALRWTEFTYDPYSGATLEKQVHIGSKVTKTTWTHSELVAGRPGTGQLDRVEVRDESGALKHWRGYTYDSKDGRLKQVTSPEGTINYTYAPTGELTGISSSAGQSVAYAHDAMGRLMSVSVAPVGGGTAQITSYEYDAVTGARKHIARGNGTSTDFTYDGPGRLTKIEHKSTTGSLELGLAYSRDLSGIITGTTETEAGAPTSSWTYGYDGLKRLTSAVCTGGQSVSYAYTYDKAANRLTETQDGITKRFSYNSLDQLITEYSAGDVRELTYDVFGNVVSEKKNGTPEREYTWDGENRLTQVRLCADGDIPEQNIYYGYDSEGTRISKSLKQGSTAAAKNTNYLTDYQNPTGYSQTIGELDPADISADRAYAFDDTGLLMQETRPDGSTGGGGGPPAYQTGYTLSDHLGTSRVLTDAQGAAQTHYTYAPFGEVKQGDSAAIHHAFTGQYREGESALQYHRARWLNPARANWLSQDPVWDWPGNFGNATAYCGGCVPNVCDSRGTETDMVGLMVAANIVMGLTNIYFDLGAIGQATPGRQKGMAIGWLVVDCLLLFTGLAGMGGFGRGAVVLADGGYVIAGRILSASKIVWILDKVLATETLWLSVKAMIVRSQFFGSSGGTSTPPTSGNVLEIKDIFPEGSSESHELAEFVKAWNEELASVGKMVRKQLSDSEKLASRAWRDLQRKMFPERYPTSDVVVGHVPDAIAGGPAAGGRVMPLSRRVNSSVGAQVRLKPVGYEYSRVVIVR